MDELLEKTLMVEGVGKTLATAAATGIIGGAAMLGGVRKAASEKPVEKPTTTIAVEEPVEKVSVDMEKIAEIESSNNPAAENKRTGARGLLQIMQPTWEEMVDKMDKNWSWNEAFDVDKNLAVGSYYMNTEIPRLLKHYGIEDTIENRLAAYNWGVGNLKNMGIEKAPQETTNYIEKYINIVEARGHWRNWEEISCSKCSWRDYKKNFVKRKESIPRVCPDCGAELKT